ncbi:MAG: glycosyltransferase family 39 protein [Kofleriaceae bacterium]
MWALKAGSYVLAAAPLGHDEAQYALAARDLLEGVPARWAHVSPGMNAVAVPGVLAGGSEEALRGFAMLVALVFPAGAALLAWRRFGLGVAAWTVALLATAKPLIRHSADLLSDLPAAALLLLATSFTLSEVTRDDGPRWRFVALGPLAAAAFYLRYASCVPIALLGVIGLAVGWRQMARRPGPVLVALGLLGVLLVPHALDSIKRTGSTLGLLLFNQRVPQSTTSGLETYFTSDPLAFYGGLLAAVALVGALAPLWDRSSRVLALWALGLGQVIVLGLVALGQFRYIFFGVTLLAILGVHGLTRAWARRAPAARRGLTVAAGALLLGAAVSSAISISKLPARRRASYADAMVAAMALRRDAAGRTCYVQTRHATQIEWYSGCSSSYFPADAQSRGAVIYYVLDPHDTPEVPMTLPGASRQVLANERLGIEVRALLPPEAP